MSRSGQKGQIFKCINVDIKGIYPDQFFAQESNGVICFYVLPPEVTKKSHLKNDVINWYDLETHLGPVWGKKLCDRLEIVYTGRRLVAE